MAITTQMRTDVANLYVALFGRAPERDGLGYWVNELNAGKTVAQVAQAMYDTTPARATYPTFLTNEEIIGRFYSNVLGRTADADGLAYWTAKLNAGASKGSVISDMITAVTAYTGTDAAAVTSKALFTNKVTVGLYYAVDLGGNDVTKAASILSGVTSAASSVETAKTGAAISAGQTFTLTDSIDILNGTSGNDEFVGDNTSANAADTITGGAGTDTVKLFNTVSLPNLSGVENLQINGNEGNVNVASISDLTSVELKNVTLSAAGAPTYTLAGTQTLTLTSVKDSDADNTDGVEIAAAASVTAQSIKLNGAGDAATGGFDLNIDVNGTGVATLNVDSSTTASRVSIENTGTAIRTLNITGDAALTVAAGAAANNVGAAATKIAITNTAGASVISSAAPNATTGLVITAVGGKDTVELAQAAGANALTNKVAVDLGAGDDTLKVTNLTAATDIQDGASFKGGEGTDTLNIVTGAVLDATRGKLFSGFEAVDLAASTGTFDLALLATNNTISALKVSAATAAAVTVNNLAETATVTVGAAINAGGLTINQKDAGAGSPDDVLGITFDSKTALTTTGNIDINDVETVNVAVTSSGTNITHTISVLTADEATKVTLNASTAAATVADLEADSVVLFDASASAKAVSVTTGADTFKATSGVAFKLGAGDDTLVLTGANTTAAAATDLDFQISGGAGADTITLAAVATGKDVIVYTAQADSTYAKFDSITNFDATAASAQDFIDLKAFGFTGAQQGVKVVATGVSVAADGTVAVASGSLANFFVDTGLSRGVAAWDSGADVFVFVDANKDGNFSNADDLVIKMVGVAAATDITTADLILA